MSRSLVLATMRTRLPSGRFSIGTVVLSELTTVSPVTFNDPRFETGNNSYVINLFSAGNGPNAMNYAFDRTIYLNVVRPVTTTVSSGEQD